MDFEGFTDIFAEQAQDWPYPDAQPIPEEDSEFVVEDFDLNEDFMPLPEQEVVAPPPPPVRRQLPPPAPRRARPIPPPPVPQGFENQPPPFPAPYPDAQFQTFTSIKDAKSYVERLDNRNDAYVAIPLAFINRIRDDPRRMPTYGYIIHH